MDSAMLVAPIAFLAGALWVTGTLIWLSRHPSSPLVALLFWAATVMTVVAATKMAMGG